MATQINTAVNQTGWTRFSLPPAISLRIALDAGPCYCFTDPVTKSCDFGGKYVIRAARMEPVTPPGNIYASGTFVALSKAKQMAGTRFEYAGQLTLPKNYGVIPAYHVI